MACQLETEAIAIKNTAISDQWLYLPQDITNEANILQLAEYW